MKPKVTALLLLLIACLSSPAWGTRLYSVDRQVGDGWVKGTIETNGGFGPHKFGGLNIIGWNLDLFDSVDYFTITRLNSRLYGASYPSYDPDEFNLFRSNIIATPYKLIFDTSIDGYALFQRGHEGDGYQNWYIGSNGDDKGYESVWALGPFDTWKREEASAVTTEHMVLATAIVPEPTSLGLLSLGIAGLFASRKLHQ